MQFGGKNINQIEHKTQSGRQGLIVICMKKMEMTHKVLLTIFMDDIDYCFEEDVVGRYAGNINIKQS